jgi:hypothetical protein
MPMRQTILALVLLAALVAGQPASPAAAAPPDSVKVVIVVGPVAEATDRYRARAEAAAAAARAMTSNVVTVYSPDATWPAVRAALQGASIVVYLGHGNGWPSMYRDAPYAATQNGFGLNPVAGVDDDAHQYFGEAWIAREIRLAPNAVVILSGLCYASGNTEPGLPEGTFDDARQRVDNYAAGFIAAGAGAVIADAHVPAAWYVHRILAGDSPIEHLWRDARSGRGAQAELASVRSQDFVLRMNPDRDDGGYYRSIVVRPGLRTTDARGSGGAIGAGGSGGSGGGEDGSANVPRDAAGNPVAEPAPTLAGSGIHFDPPLLADTPRAGTTTTLSIPYATPGGAALPGALSIGSRWDPIDVPAAAEGPFIVEPIPGTGRLPRPGSDPPGRTEGTLRAGKTPNEGRPPAAEPGPTTTPGTDEPEASHRDPWLLVQPERRGSLVTPVVATVGERAIAVEVGLPEQPGLYRLVLTLHDADGLAFDGPTQELLSGLVVRVLGPLAAGYDAPDHLAVTAGATFRLPVTVVNLGAEPWGHDEERGDPGDDADEAGEHPSRAALTGRWLSLAPDTGVHRAASSLLKPGLAPGSEGQAVLVLDAPARPGVYLLILDLLVPGNGSLASHGVEPGIVRVTVTAP